MKSVPAALAAFQPSAPLRHVVEAMRIRGHEVWMVGGVVRDLARGAGAGEIDLATSAGADEVAAIFSKVVETGIDHGTVTVLEGGEAFELTSFRGADPRSIAEDLALRDFTINAMAYDPLEGTFLDPHGGLEDLERRLVRGVGDPESRLREDPLRAMRACRFAARFGFRIERETRRAIPRILELFPRVAVERVQSELSKILLAPHPRYGIELLRRTGLLAQVIPELLEGLGMRQNRWHRYDVYHHVLRSLDAAPARLVVRLATLLHDIDKPRTAAPSPKAAGELSFYNHEKSGAARARAICERLRYPNRLAADVEVLVREHQFVYTDEWSDGAVRRMLARVGEARFDDLLAVREADIRGRGIATTEAEGLENLRALAARVHRLQASRPALQVKDLVVTGQDVIAALGIEPSPAVGEALKHLLDRVLEDPASNERGVLLEELERWSRRNF